MKIAHSRTRQSACFVFGMPSSIWYLNSAAPRTQDDNLARLGEEAYDQSVKLAAFCEAINGAGRGSANAVDALAKEIVSAVSIYSIHIHAHMSFLHRFGKYLCEAISGAGRGSADAIDARRGDRVDGMYI